jgi:hypothetical protein
MTRIFTTMLVGAHFVPPAKLVLEHLASGTELILEPYDDNPYDSSAIRVLVEPRLIPESQHGVLDEKLPGAGSDMQTLLASGPLVLGHVASSGGKPLAKANASGPIQYVGTLEVREALTQPGHEAKLGFDPAGLPIIYLTVSISGPAGLIESEEEQMGQDRD